MCDHYAMRSRLRDTYALAVLLFALVGCSDSGNASPSTVLASEPTVTRTAPDSSEACASTARSTAMEAIASFDEGDLDAVSALVAPPAQFRFVSMPGSTGAIYDRGRVAIELRRLFETGERVVRPASKASDSAAMQVRVFAPSIDPAGGLVAGISVSYHDGGAVKFQIACPGRSIIGISWDIAPAVS